MSSRRSELDRDGCPDTAAGVDPALRAAAGADPFGVAPSGLTRNTHGIPRQAPPAYSLLRLDRCRTPPEARLHGSWPDPGRHLGGEDAPCSPVWWKRAVQVCLGMSIMALLYATEQVVRDVHRLSSCRDLVAGRKAAAIVDPETRWWRMTA